MNKKNLFLGSCLSAKSIRSFMLLFVMMFTTSTARAQEGQDFSGEIYNWLSCNLLESYITLTFISEYHLAPYDYETGVKYVGSLGENTINIWRSRDSHKITNSNGEEVDCYDYYLTNATSEYDGYVATNCADMFHGLCYLVAVNFVDFDTSNVTNMNAMFLECSGLTSLDLSNFDTSNVTGMCDMFNSCSGLTSLDLSNFDTSNVTDMSGMFGGCQNLTSLNLSNFDTSNVTDMSGMFGTCSNLTSLTIGNFDMYNAESTNDMFGYSPNLKTLTLKSVPFLKNGTFNSKFTGTGVTVNYLLDDNSTGFNGTNYLPAATTPSSYSRTMKNQWGTIVLPFDVNTNSSNPYDFYEIASVDSDELVLSKITGTLSAGTPALIRIYSDEVDGKTYDLNITAANSTLNTTGALTQTTGSLSLVGAYDYKDITAENGYIISNNAFWNIQTVKGENKVYCSPFRAYISSSSASGARLRIGDVEDQSTGIAALDALNSSAAEYYDINGRRLNDLQKGINIIKVNGKVTKVMIK